MLCFVLLLLACDAAECVDAVGTPTVCFAVWLLTKTGCNAVYLQ